MNNELIEKLHDTNYILNKYDIENLRDICYRMGYSCFPIDTFFNDVYYRKEENFNRNQALKDLYLIALQIIEYEEAFEVLTIIKVSPKDVFSTLDTYDSWEEFKEDCEYNNCSTFPFANKNEFDLLKEHFHNGKKED